MLEACLQGKQSFVIDNTNPLPSDRSRYIGPARASGFRVAAYFFETTLQDAIRRNNQRVGKHRIPVPGVASTFRKLLGPKLEEGFDEIYTVRISPENGFVVERESSPPAER